MNYFEVKNKIKSSPAVKLLKKDSAPLVISFLHKRFKVTRKITIPFSEIEESLTDYIEELYEVKEIHNSPPSVYLRHWIEEGFLRNNFDEEKDDFAVELTPDDEINEEKLEELLMHTHIDMEELKSNIQRVLRYKKEVSLKEVLSQFPPKEGLEEVVSYVQLAQEGERHQIDGSRKEKIYYFKDNEGELKRVAFQVPHVIFRA